MPTRLSRHCPVCRSAFGNLLHAQHFLEVQGSPLPSRYDIVSCVQCSFVFADVNASQSDYDAYYAGLSNYEDDQISSGSGLTDWDSRRLSATADEIERHLSKDAHILDVGSAQGGLLRILSRRGFKRLSALEPSKTCVAKLPAGIEAYVGQIHDLADTLNEPVEAIVLSHVLEHIYDIEGAMENLTSSLAPGGLLYVEVPDASRYAEFFKTSFHYFDAEHINHFDEGSLRTLIGLYGYETLSSGSKEMEISDSELYPAIFMVLRRRHISKEVQNYIEISSANDNSEQLGQLLSAGKPIAIWGFGSYTKRLLATTDLARCKIEHIVDGDPKKHGTSVGSLQIQDPSVLKLFDGTVVVSSALYSNAIRVAAAELGLRNHMVIMR